MKQTRNKPTQYHERFELRIEKEILNEMRKYAYSNNMTVSQFIREAAKKQLKIKESKNVKI